MAATQPRRTRASNSAAGWARDGRALDCRAVGLRRGRVARNGERNGRSPIWIEWLRFLFRSP